MNAERRPAGQRDTPVLARHRSGDRSGLWLRNAAAGLGVLAAAAAVVSFTAQYRMAETARGLPVVALCSAGPALADVESLVENLRSRGATVLVVGNGEHVDLSLPVGAPDALMPILAVLRGQQLAHALALRLGYDPDSPEGLTKVTQT